MSLKLRIHALMIGLLLLSCGDDSPSAEEPAKDAGRADAGHVDAAVKDAATPKDASVADAAHDAEVLQSFDAGRDAGKDAQAELAEKLLTDAGCVLYRCSNPFDCTRNIGIPSCMRLACIDNYCQ